MIRSSAAYTALAISLLSAVASQLLIKWRFDQLGVGAALGNGAGETIGMIMGDLLCWLGALLLIVGAILWYLALMRLPIHVMLPLAATVSPAASIGACLFLGESLTVPKMAAIATIFAGVAWLGVLQS